MQRVLPGRILHDHGELGAQTLRRVVHELPLEVLDATARGAVEAAEVKVKYKLYYADSFAAALALEHKATLVTKRHGFPEAGAWGGSVLVEELTVFLSS